MSTDEQATNRTADHEITTFHTADRNVPSTEFKLLTLRTNMAIVIVLSSSKKATGGLGLGHPSFD